MKHNEPWSVRVSCHDGIIRSDTSKYVVSIHNGTSYQDTVCASEGLTKKDAEAWHDRYQRIVDCVNACAGITSDALKAGYIKHLVEWDEVNHNCLDTVDSKVTPFEFKGVKILEDTK